MIEGINHITIAVRELGVSIDFYKEILQLRPLCIWDKGAYFLAGDVWFCLNVDEKRRPSPCYTHYAFSVSKERFMEFSTRVLQKGVEIFKENTSPGLSLYFLDPDGHKLEIHCETWKDRVAFKKQNPGSWNNITWFV